MTAAEPIDLQATLATLVEMQHAGDTAGMERIRAGLTQQQVTELQQRIFDRLSARMTAAIVEHLGGTPQPVVSVEPLTDGLRRLPGRRYDPHQFAVVERGPGGTVVVHDTANSEWHARAVALSYVASHNVSLALTPLQIVGGDVLVDDDGIRHTVTSVYPVEPLSVTLHTNTGQHKHFTWSEALTTRYTIDVRGNR